MQKAFLSNLVLMLVLNLLIKPIYIFGIDIGVQNAIGTENYGMYAKWLSFAMLFGILHDFGLQNYNSVSISKNPGLLQNRLPVLLALKLILSITFVVFVSFCAWIYGATVKDLLLVIGSTTLLSTMGLLQLLRTNLGAQGEYQINSWISVVDRVVLIVIVGCLLFIPALKSYLSIEVFIIVQLIALLISIGLSLFFTKTPHRKLSFDFDFKQMKVILEESIPFGWVLVLTTLFSRIDIVMLEAIAEDGYYQSGLYAGAYRILDALNMIGYMFSTLLLPMLSKQIEEKQDTNPLLYISDLAMTIIGFGISIWISINAHSIMNLWYKESTPQWGETLSWLVFSTIAIGLGYIYGSYLLAHKKTKILNRIYAIAIVLNIVLNSFLIKQLSSTGAAISTVATEGFVIISSIIIVSTLNQGLFTFSYFWKRILMGLVLFLIAYHFSIAEWGWTLSIITYCLGILLSVIILLKKEDIVRMKELFFKIKN